MDLSNMMTSNSNERKIIEEAILHHQQGELELAQEKYRQVLEKNPNSFDALHLLGCIEGQKKNYIASIIFFNQAISINPTDPIVFNNRGNIFNEMNAFDEALASYDEAIRIDDKYSEPLFNKGVLFESINKKEEALQCYTLAISRNSNHFKAFCNQAILLKQLGNIEKALDSIQQAIKIDPSNYVTYNLMGKFYYSKKDYSSAINSFTKAIELNNSFMEGFNNLGNALAATGQSALAMETYNTVLMLEPNNSEALFNKGLLFEEFQKYDLALESYNHSLLIAPNAHGVHLNKGNVLKKMAKFDEAMLAYDAALSLKSDYSEPLSNSGLIYQELRDFDKALEYYNRAISIGDLNLTPLYNRGQLYKECLKFSEAISDFKKLYEIDKNYPYILGEIFYCNMFICDWNTYEADLNSLINNTFSHSKCSASFSFLTSVDSPELQKISAEIWFNDKVKVSNSLGAFRTKNKSKKIVLGYFSSDFYNHATSFLIAELFELHDKDKFELIAFSFGADSNDEMRNRLLESFDKFIDVKKMSDMQVAELSRELGVDIAIDLKGYTLNSRPSIFAYRAAPIQVNYLGYPGTMGDHCYDYLLSDKVVIPKQSQSFYTEKIAYLPNCYQVNDSKRILNNFSISRSDVGLPDEGFVYCCFNSSYKITPYIFDVWMRVLSEVKDSVLWLLEQNSDSVKNLHLEAEKRGIDKSRIIFSPRIEHDQHLQRFFLADLFLDTFPCTAHTTASDSLRCGIPLLTIAGESFVSRVASSLLDTLELGDLIANSFQEYEKLAILLGSDKIRMDHLKTKLLNNIVNAPLFNTELFTTHLEKLFVEMQKRFLDNAPLGHILIEN